MLMAIILRSLPDSVFDYFHSHTHVSYTDFSTDPGTKVEDYKHNCHIEDWNFESFEVTEQQYISPQYTTQQKFSQVHHELVVSVSIPQNGRAPPVA